MTTGALLKRRIVSTETHVLSSRVEYSLISSQILYALLKAESNHKMAKK